MRKTIMAAMLSGAMLLGGCATVGQPVEIDKIIVQVQSITRQVCGFIPIAQTITAIVTAGQFTEAFSIANAICAAVTAPPREAMPGARSAPRRAPFVSGVPVKGRFVGR